MPVIYAAGGNCHVYVDAGADLEKATRIIINAKCQRPGVCNAAETLLVHADVAAAFLPRAVDELKRRGVELVVDKARRGPAGRPLAEARQQDALRDRVPGPQARRARGGVAGRGPGAHRHLRHAPLRGHRHRRPGRGARASRAGVDAACVYVNASTRFTDGGQFGLGAEMGISTQKLHARGPIALQELTSVKYELWGDGQVRG